MTLSVNVHQGLIDGLNKTHCAGQINICSILQENINCLLVSILAGRIEWSKTTLSIGESVTDRYTGESQM